MWGVQGVAQRQEPLHHPLTCLLVCVHQTSLSYTCLPSHGPSFSPTPGLYTPNLSLTQPPWSAYACPPPSQPLVHIHQPSFLLVSWFMCPSFVLVCPSLHIPNPWGLLVHVHSPSLFLGPQFMFVSCLTGLLGYVHCQLCACVCWSPLPGRACLAFIRDCLAFSHAHLGSFWFVYPLVGWFSNFLASYLYL